ncbi:hypothetical protein B0H66DRAFT_535564 [Apodospora peruviana]|uniref:Uncharacterized protein n=1 Tax=Apodospora peruviana TaxID=516989 RepID=A0AAE0M0G0_9PEZI|nr:hypothetical protein B0H66DRAFT_535564 [Apodospora peruviana]
MAVLVLASSARWVCGRRISTLGYLCHRHGELAPSYLPLTPQTEASQNDFHEPIRKAATLGHTSVPGYPVWLILDAIDAYSHNDMSLSPVRENQRILRGVTWKQDELRLGIKANYSEELTVGLNAELVKTSENRGSLMAASLSGSRSFQVIIARHEVHRSDRPCSSIGEKQIPSLPSMPSINAMISHQTYVHLSREFRVPGDTGSGSGRVCRPSSKTGRQPSNAMARSGPARIADKGSAGVDRFRGGGLISVSESARSHLRPLKLGRPTRARVVLIEEGKYGLGPIRYLADGRNVTDLYVI